MKEIVITNKNGITLPTKKTLVNDDIKIKLDNSIKAIDGVTETDTGIVLVETPKEKPITIKGDHEEINVTQGSVKLNLNAYAEITLADNSEMNSIVTENLAPENIAKDVTILGVTGTFEGGTPIELATSEEMEAVLVAENIGKIYKYIGETNETFTNGNLYQVMEVE